MTGPKGGGGMAIGNRLASGWRVGVSRPFAAYHAAVRNFFMVFVILCWLGVIMGFMPAVLKRFGGDADYPASLVLQIHVFAATGWLLLLTMQVGLIRSRRPDVHKQLGLAALI